MTMATTSEPARGGFGIMTAMDGVERKNLLSGEGHGNARETRENISVLGPDRTSVRTDPPTALQEDEPDRCHMRRPVRTSWTL